jgi:hypothetical protein
LGDFEEVGVIQVDNEIWVESCRNGIVSWKTGCVSKRKLGEEAKACNKEKIKCHPAELKYKY